MVEKFSKMFHDFIDSIFLDLPSDNDAEELFQYGRAIYYSGLKPYSAYEERAVAYYLSTRCKLSLRGIHIPR
ncbi:hypothetical protein [Paenirhodobacter populi]|uniref:hypothetical protein n=1 Tax=Paenirhodobacter populi TaxID=2306993 RepID=UPI000FE443C6|nr:hypothetical protein [Sinirhodobacter populi]RWR04681.1 hypothetical protein D2T32_19075 [Sinirhodobacter populi]